MQKVLGRFGAVVLVGVGAVGAVAACETAETSPPSGGVAFDSGTFDAPAASDAPVTDAIPATDTGVDAGPTGCVAAGTDTYWSQVLVYIPCTTTIEDLSGRSTLALFNNPIVSTMPEGAPGGASCSLGNSGGYSTAKGFQITMPASVGAGDYTIELSVFQTAWYDPSDQQSEILIGNSAYPPSLSGFPAFFSHAVTNQIQFIASTTNAYTDPTSALNVWQSYAASRISGTTRLFRNGVLLTSFPDDRDYTDTIIHVGHQANGTYNAVMGSVGQIRITNAGRYTTSYEACAAGFATR